MTEPIERSVFLLGPTGVGKSALGNELIDKDDEHQEGDDEGVEHDAECFGVSSGSSSETIKVSFREKLLRVVSRTAEMVGQVVNSEPLALRLRVADSPGLSDTEGRSTKFLDAIMEAIRGAKPHGIIIVIQAGKDSHEFQLSLRALAECLGTSIEDTRRVALFVNKLPTEFQFRQQRPPIKSKEKQAEKRLEMVEQCRNRASELLRLEKAFYLRTAIGNTFGTFDGVETLRQFIANMPEDPMDVSKLRTWTEAREQAKRAVFEAEARARAIKRRMQDLENRVLTLEKNIAYYRQQMGTGYMVTGLGAVAVSSVAYGASLFVPGVNLATLAVGTTAAAGGFVGGKATANVIDSWKLPEALEKARDELHSFKTQDHTHVSTEIRRLRNMLNQIEELQRKIDSSLRPSKL